jgi:hypothetical protein
MGKQSVLGGRAIDQLQFHFPVGNSAAGSLVPNDILDHANRRFQDRRFDPSRHRTPD